MSQTPSVARIVMAMGPRARGNGAQEAPAIITRVWSGPNENGAWLVNAMIFLDAGNANPATSVYIYADRKAAEEAIAKNEHATVLFWPERVA